MLSLIQGFASKFALYIVLGLLVVIAGESLYIAFLRKDLQVKVAQNATLNSAIMTQNQAVEQLKKETLQLKDKAIQIQKDADEALKKRKVVTNRIMVETVSKDCQEALSWAIKKGAEIGGSW
jgi:beta-lactam-binding protein with PASTA domain